EYSYRQAVIDGFLIDHEPPIRIVTQLAKNGMKWQQGDEMEIFRTRTGTVELCQVPDEVNIEVDEFNKSVVTENFNRVVCQELVKHIDPSLPGKTMVFCATDSHADLVVKILKEEFDLLYGGIDDNAVMKITGAADKPLEKIRLYKNEQLPSIAVTVDLLTTGIDVPQIVNLVFIRRVRSRILYEQMLGRATRLCEEIGKDWFEVYDAVGIYESMKVFTDMKPVVANPAIGFEQLAEEILGADKLPPAQVETARITALEQFRAKLKRKVARLSDSDRVSFEAKVGAGVEEFVALLATATPGEAAGLLEKLPSFGSWLDRLGTGKSTPLPISTHADTLVSTHRKYFIADTAQNYLEQFKAYIESHSNEIAALRAVTTKPASLTRKDLRALLITLDEAGFAESMLREAWHEATNADVAASVIGYIRRQALGDPLVPWEERVDKALAKLTGTRSFTPPQLQWLDRIVKQMKTELVVDRAVLDSGVFRDQGGFNRINTIFKGKLEHTIEELSELMWKSPA
ncbi:MAG: type I restriction-modification enzyme R subunit C-terminal domain-containing protein, partial [Spirochaetota bacterium]